MYDTQTEEEIISEHFARSDFHEIFNHVCDAPLWILVDRHVHERELTEDELVSFRKIEQILYVAAMRDTENYFPEFVTEFARYFGLRDEGKGNDGEFKRQSDVPGIFDVPQFSKSPAGWDDLADATRANASGVSLPVISIIAAHVRSGGD